MKNNAFKVIENIVNEKLEKVVNDFKTRAEVEKITRVELEYYNILRIYYNVKEEYAKKENLQFIERVHTFNIKTGEQSDFADDIVLHIGGA